jgi:hypothetical protein
MLRALRCLPLFAVAACASNDVAPTPASPPLLAQSEVPPECRAYATSVIIAGQQTPATGLACPQPDGSWRISQTAPGLMQVHEAPAGVLYPPPYAYYGPSTYAPPVALGLGAAFVVKDRHHHRRHHHHDRGRQLRGGSSNNTE